MPNSGYEECLKKRALNQGGIWLLQEGRSLLATGLPLPQQHDQPSTKSTTPFVLNQSEGPPVILEAHPSLVPTYQDLLHAKMSL